MGQLARPGWCLDRPTRLSRAERWGASIAQALHRTCSRRNGPGQTILLRGPNRALSSHNYLDFKFYCSWALGPKLGVLARSLTWRVRVRSHEGRQNVIDGLCATLGTAINTITLPGPQWRCLHPHVAVRTRGSSDFENRSIELGRTLKRAAGRPDGPRTGAPAQEAGQRPAAALLPTDTHLSLGS